jgi:hypothetical protein
VTTPSKAPSKKIAELNENELKRVIESRKGKLKEMKRGSFSYVATKNTIFRLEKELEKRKALQSR